MNYQVKVLEKLDDEDWNLTRISKVVMKPIKNPPSKKDKFSTLYIKKKLNFFEIINTTKTSNKKPVVN